MNAVAPARDLRRFIDKVSELRRLCGAGLSIPQCIDLVAMDHDLLPAEVQAIAKHFKVTP